VGGGHSQLDIADTRKSAKLVAWVSRKRNPPFSLLRRRIALSLFTRGQDYSAGAMPGAEGFDDLPEESWRQEPVIIAIAATDFPQIIARPIEFVALRNDNPGAFFIQAKMDFDDGGDFDGACGIGGSSMGDRQNHNRGRIIRGALDRQHDHARTIFSPFLATCFALVMPKIGIANDEARLGRRYRHANALFLLEHGIKMRVPVVHA